MNIPQMEQGIYQAAQIEEIIIKSWLIFFTKLFFNQVLFGLTKERGIDYTIYAFDKCDYNKHR